MLSINNHPTLIYLTFINFSPSPNHLDATLLALILKKLNFDSVATAFASNVLPVPGGPNSNTPLGGDRNPIEG